MDGFKVEIWFTISSLLFSKKLLDIDRKVSINAMWQMAKLLISDEQKAFDISIESIKMTNNQLKKDERN